MVVEAGRQPAELLADTAPDLAAGADLRAALASIAAVAARAVAADLAVLRVVDAQGDLVARAVAPEGSALGAEVAGTRSTSESAAAGAVSEAVSRAAGQARAEGTLVVAARVGGRVVGSVELLRVATPFTGEERAVADLVAAQLALALRLLAPEGGAAAAGRRAKRLELAGEALAAGGDVRRAAPQAVRIAMETSGANAGALWRLADGHDPELIASLGSFDALTGRPAELVRAAVESWRPAAVEHDPSLPGGAAFAVTLPVGQPAFAALQLFYPEDGMPGATELAALGAFSARAAHALRAGERARVVELELKQTRSLLEVVGDAISRLSLAHTLGTAVERIDELLAIDHIGIYLHEEGLLVPAAGRGLAFGHERIADLMLEAVLGPLRARSAVFADVRGSEPSLAAVRAALAEAGQTAALAVPLQVREEPVGLLVAYPGGSSLGESEVALLLSLAAQLAVAVQNARLHEQATELGKALSSVLASERQTSRQVNALYEISRSFAQSLSLDTTLAAVTKTIVEVLGVDAAVIRVPDERGDQFVPRAVYVAESRLADAVRTILERPQPRPARSFDSRPLDEATATRLGGAHALLVPFLGKGSTAALLPITTATELLAELTILSLDPAAPIDADTLATARTIAQQAALAIDNARLYQQQKLFAETMQQSLLPRERPSVPGLEVGAVYESAAQVDVGGDVFDFLELADGRLAVVLGDVTGHGIDATADMAMAKFVFRSLAREHPEPSAFLAHANEVVVGEIAVGKFITMAYLTIDPGGEVLCASAGHPEPRLVLPGGRVEPLPAGGLALGIDAPQVYEQVRVGLPVGGSVVLYTDGVVEARTGRELFGVERLDAVLAAHAESAPQAIAEAVIEACRAYSGGNLTDDCAVVVIKR